MNEIEKLTRNIVGAAKIAAQDGSPFIDIVVTGRNPDGTLVGDDGKGGCVVTAARANVRIGQKIRIGTQQPQSNFTELPQTSLPLLPFGLRPRYPDFPPDAPGAVGFGGPLNPRPGGPLELPRVPPGGFGAMGPGVDGGPGIIGPPPDGPPPVGGPPVTEVSINGITQTALRTIQEDDWYLRNFFPAPVRYKNAAARDINADPVTFATGGDCGTVWSHTKYFTTGIVSDEPYSTVTYYRTVLQFDANGKIPAGAVITSAYVSPHPDNGRTTARQPFVLLDGSGMPDFPLSGPDTPEHAWASFGELRSVLAVIPTYFAFAFGPFGGDRSSTSNADGVIGSDPVDHPKQITIVRSLLSTIKQDGTKTKFIIMGVEDWGNHPPMHGVKIAGVNGYPPSIGSPHNYFDADYGALDAQEKSRIAIGASPLPVLTIGYSFL